MRSKVLMLALVVSTFLTTPTLAATKYRAHKPKNCNVLLVGDSRTVGTIEAISDNDVAYICEVGQGYHWLKTKALSDIRKYTEKDMDVVFNLGVNDVKNAELYISMYNDLFKELSEKGCNVYLETVNPTDGSGPSNKAIAEFNTKLINSVSNCKVINTNVAITKEGYKCPDGLHYNRATTLSIYNKVREVLKEGKRK